MAEAAAGDLRIRAGDRQVTFRLPARVIFGRRHTVSHSRPIGETHLSLSSDPQMSREWFSIEDIRMSSCLSGESSSDPVLLVTCLSSKNGVQIWDGADPVRIRPHGKYLVQGSTMFVGDLIRGRIIGARAERVASMPERRPEATLLSMQSGVTVRSAELDIRPMARQVLIARYHRYYRTPPDFDPQPLPWADVAVLLGLLTTSQAADGTLLRRSIKRAQDAVTSVKQQMDLLYPGWLPAGSETQKTFHDHLRTVLEMHGFFEPSQLAAFDESMAAARTAARV